MSKIQLLKKNYVPSQNVQNLQFFAYPPGLIELITENKGTQAETTFRPKKIQNSLAETVKLRPFSLSNVPRE